MKRLEALNQIRYNQILDIMLTAEEKDLISDDVSEFIGHNHNLPTAVVNVILIKSIIMTKNKGRLPNAAYMRMVAESFKSQDAFTLVRAIEKMDHDKEFALKQVKNGEPIEWLDDYKKELEKMEGNA